MRKTRVATPSTDAAMPLKTQKGKRKKKKKKKEREKKK